MKCPMCEKATRPTEIDLQAELVVYDCKECATAWHVMLGELDGNGAPRVMVQDDSTLFWIVTCETRPEAVPQVQRPGWRQSLRTIGAMVENMWEAGRVCPGDGLEFTASADPEHHEYRGLSAAWVTVRVSVEGPGDPK